MLGTPLLFHSTLSAARAVVRFSECSRINGATRVGVLRLHASFTASVAMFPARTYGVRTLGLHNTVGTACASGQNTVLQRHFSSNNGSDSLSAKQYHELADDALEGFQDMIEEALEELNDRSVDLECSVSS